MANSTKQTDAAAKKISDVVLVYDRYYTKKPGALPLALKRAALCCGVTVCAVIFLIGEYRFPVNRVLAAAFCVAFCALFSLIFSFVKKRVFIPAAVGISAFLIFVNREEFWEKFSYFHDALWLAADGRFIDGKLFLVHTEKQLAPDLVPYLDGLMFGTVIFIAVFSMITAACFFTKPRILPSFVLFVALWSPVLLSEKFTFNLWIIPTVALYMGAFSLSLVHRDGLAVKSGADGSYRLAAMKSERNYVRNLNRSSLGKRAHMNAVYYSKYFASAVSAAALFLAAGVLSSVILSSSEGFDYTKIAEFFKNEVGSHFVSPFESGPASEFFTTSEDTVKTDSGLSIISPERGNQEIMRVTNNGEAVVYLRGDIGIDFLGRTWSSPVNSKLIHWDGKLPEIYRPVETIILQSFKNRYHEMPPIVSSCDITIDYLCETDVLFLPAYTSDFGFYENEMFNIYGDYAARVDPSYERMNVVRCTALVPLYTYLDEQGEQSKKCMKNAAQIVADWDIPSAVDKMLSDRESIYIYYESYVENTYLKLPDDKQLNETLEQFLQEHNFQNLSADTKTERDYLTAAAVADFLHDEYTYSVDAPNDDSRAVEDFLTRTKSGHCALYASSMTLLMRHMGIPARYCTGFVVKPNGGSPTILRSKNLHAWCEVYISGLGWVTFDPTSSTQSANGGVEDTPSSSSSSSEDESSEEESSEESSESSASSESSSGQTSADSSGDSEIIVPTQPEKVNILPYIAAALGAAVAAAAVILVIRRYRRFNDDAKKALRRYAKVTDANVILEKILTVLRVCRITPAVGEMPEKFYARAGETLGFKAEDYRDVLEAAAFGEDAVDENGCAKLASLLSKICQSAEKQLKFPDRIRLKLTLLKK